MRLPHAVYEQLKEVAAVNGEIEFAYPQHGSGRLTLRQGRVWTIGFGPLGGNLTVKDAADVFRTYALGKIQNLKILGTV